MKPREKLLALIIAVLAGVFAADRLLIAPVGRAFAQVSEESQGLESELTEAQTMIKSQSKIEQRWQAVRNAGLNAAIDEARIRVQVEANQWSEDSGLSLNTLSTGRVVEGEEFDRMTFSLTGVGDIDSISSFLVNVEQADFPLRITDCAITRRGDEGKQLTLSLKLSTIVRPGETGEDMSVVEVSR